MSSFEQRLMETFRYDPATGGIFRIKTTAQFLNTRADKLIKRTGYRRVKSHGKYFAAHRLVWLLTHGAWPNAEIDHINGDRGDNRIENLREATIAQNNRNSIKPRKSPYGTGVQRLRGGRYQALIWHNRRSIYLGMHDTAELAAQAYRAAAEKYHGEFSALKRPS